MYKTNKILEKTIFFTKNSDEDILKSNSKDYTKDGEK